MTKGFFRRQFSSSRKRGKPPIIDGIDLLCETFSIPSRLGLDHRNRREAIAATRDRESRLIISVKKKPKQKNYTESSDSSASDQNPSPMYESPSESESTESCESSDVNHSVRKDQVRKKMFPRRYSPIRRSSRRRVSRRASSRHQNDTENEDDQKPPKTAAATTSYTPHAPRLTESSIPPPPPGHFVHQIPAQTMYVPPSTPVLRNANIPRAVWSSPDLRSKSKRGSGVSPPDKGAFQSSNYFGKQPAVGKWDPEVMERLSRLRLKGNSSQTYHCSSCGTPREQHLVRNRRSATGDPKYDLNYCERCFRKKYLAKETGGVHFCFGCGFVRSQAFQEDHPWNQNSKKLVESYCSICREGGYKIAESTPTPPSARKVSFNETVQVRTSPPTSEDPEEYPELPVDGTASLSTENPTLTRKRGSQQSSSSKSSSDYPRSPGSSGVFSTPRVAPDYIGDGAMSPGKASAYKGGSPRRSSTGSMPRPFGSFNAYKDQSELRRNSTESYDGTKQPYRAANGAVVDTCDKQPGDIPNLGSYSPPKTSQNSYGFRYGEEATGVNRHGNFAEASYHEQPPPPSNLYSHYDQAGYNTSASHYFTDLFSEPSNSFSQEEPEMSQSCFNYPTSAGPKAKTENPRPPYYKESSEGCHSYEQFPNHSQTTPAPGPEHHSARKTYRCNPHNPWATDQKENTWHPSATKTPPSGHREPKMPPTGTVTELEDSPSAKESTVSRTILSPSNRGNMLARQGELAGISVSARPGGNSNAFVEYADVSEVFSDRAGRFLLLNIHSIS
jgi:hypothetical protein